MGLPEPTEEALARELALLREAQAAIPPPRLGGDPAKGAGAVTKRTLLLWVLFVLAFVAIWQFVSPEGGTQRPTPAAPTEQ